MQIILAIIILGSIILIASRWESHRLIKEEGGIRTKYNNIFSFFYNLPNSYLGIETKSFITFTIKDFRCEKNIRLNYYMDHLSITCKVNYKDDTAFDNGKKFEWSVWPNIDSESKILSEIQKTFASLP